MTDTPMREMESLFGKLTRTGRPAVDVSESDEEFTISMDLPGYDRDDITVRMTDHTLHVRAERESESETEEDESYIRKEREHHSVSRTIQLPETIEEDAAEATHRNGVLTITVPKESESHEEEHTIPIS